MKKTKLIVGIVLALCLLPLSLSVTGCRTVVNPDGTEVKVPILSESQLEMAGFGIQTITRYGVDLAIGKDENARAYFQVAAATLELLASTNALDTAYIDQALRNISVKEIRDHEIVRAAIISALGAYSVLEGQVVSAKLDKVAYLKPVLRHMIAGIKAGIASAPAPVPAGKAIPKVWPYPISS